MSTDMPKAIRVDVEISKEMSIGHDDLKHWTLDELREFVEEGYAGEGEEFIVQDAHVVTQDVEGFEVDRKAFDAYVKWREENGLVDRYKGAPAGQKSGPGEPSR